MNEKDISREELFALVWEKPTVEVARELGISDVAVAKLCARLQVPKPPRGYWARVRAGATPRRPPLHAFREEIEARRRLLHERRPAGEPLSSLQRKFLDRALQEISAAGTSLVDVRLAGGRLVEMPADVAAAAILLVQNRYVRWVETGAVDATLSEPARRSLGGLVEKLLPLAGPQVLVLERAERGRFELGPGPLLMLRLAPGLQRRIASLARLAREHGLQHVVAPIAAQEGAWSVTPVHLGDRFSLAETVLCISATELWAECRLHSPGFDGRRRVETVTTERAPLRAVMPIDLLPAKEVEAGVALRRVRVRDHWPRLRALVEAERALDILDQSAAALSDGGPDERLALVDRIWFGEARPLRAAREAFRALSDELDAWMDALEAERVALAFSMLGLAHGDVIVHPKGGSIVRLEIAEVGVRVMDGMVGFEFAGRRFRKDGSPGRREERLFLHLSARDPGR